MTRLCEACYGRGFFEQDIWDEYADAHDSEDVLCEQCGGSGEVIDDDNETTEAA